MQIEPVRLPVEFIPPQIEPAQALENRIERGLRVAIDIRIVNAQNHRPVMAPDVKPIENEGSRAPDMQVARRGRSKANTNH